jgi:hypothetical protein
MIEVDLLWEVATISSFVVVVLLLVFLLFPLGG